MKQLASEFVDEIVKYSGDHREGLEQMVELALTQVREDGRRAGYSEGFREGVMRTNDHTARTISLLRGAFGGRQ